MGQIGPAPALPSSAPKAPVPRFWDYFFRQKYKSRVAQYQNEYNYWMWQQENKYNSPASQVQRYKDAGLNTALMYGQGNPGNAQKGQDAAVAEFNPQVAGGVLDRFLDSKMKLAQIADVQNSARLKGAQATDLMKDIESKEGLWMKEGMNIQDFDPKNLSPRDRARYYELEKQAIQLNKELSNSRSAESTANILEKIDNLKNIMLIVQMFSGVGGVVGRFIK